MFEHQSNTGALNCGDDCGDDRSIVELRIRCAALPHTQVTIKLRSMHSTAQDLKKLEPGASVVVVTDD